MRKLDDHNAHPLAERIWSHVALFAFGLALLVFFAAIDHLDWARVKPASGTAAAMGAAAERS